MSNRIEEKELVLPALYLIQEKGKLNTSSLIKMLTAKLCPTGEDAEILSGRNDTKFSQKVRNLMGSHYSSNGMDAYTNKDSNGFFSLTVAGQEYLKDNQQNVSDLINSGFSYEKKATAISSVHATSKNKEKVCIYDENVVIEEGNTATATSVVRKRSAELRKAAIEEYTSNTGEICCCVCGFNFKEMYGELGNGYIEIHHEEPICQLPSKGVSEFIKEAVSRVKPVCSNCHRMIHRNKANILSIQQLKDIINKNE